MTRAAFITDTHIGLGFKDDRVYKVLNSYADAMDRLQPDVIFHLGDVFHTKRPAADAIEFATTWFTRLAQAATTVVVLAGGHDTDAHMGITAIDFLDDLSDNIKIILEPESLGNILLMPYIRRLENKHLKMLTQHDIVFMHQGIADAPLDNQGRKYGTVMDAVNSEYLHHLCLCLNGHMHTPWTSGNIHVIGSPYPTRRGMLADSRSYPVLDLENLDDLTFYNYEDTFSLKKVNVEYDPDPDLKLKNDLYRALPPRETNVFYYVDIAVTGQVTQALYLEIRKIVESVYKKQLDDLSVISVLPHDQRDAIDSLKRATRKMENTSPVAMMQVWMEDRRRKAYFDANPKLRERMVAAFGDIVSGISGSLDATFD